MKEIYTRDMLNNVDFEEEVMNYIDNDMSEDEMIEDVRNILVSECDFEDDEILGDYLDNMSREYENKRRTENETADNQDI